MKTIPYKKLKKKKILFLPSSGNHIKFFEPISKKIKSNQRFLYLTQGSFKDEGITKELEKSKIPFKTIDDYPKIDPDFILEQENIGLVVVGNDFDVVPQWFINSAKKKQIPSILIQDGLLLDIHPLNDDFFHKLSMIINKPSKKLLRLSLRLRLSKKIGKISYGQAGCTQIHVWNEYSKNFLVKKQIPSSSIYITGNIRLDASKAKMENVNSKNSFILYAPTDLIHTKILHKEKVIKIIDQICKTSSLFSNSKLVIKPHPIEDRNFYNIFREKYGSKIEISTEDISKLISNSSFLITNLSAVALDALHQNKPVLIFLPELKKIVNSDVFPFDLISKGVVLYAKDAKQLEEKLKYLSQNNFHFSTSHQEAIANYLGLGNNSLQKISNSINDLMKAD